MEKRGEYVTDLPTRIRTSANDHVWGFLLQAITLLVVQAKLVGAARDGDIVRHKGINDKFLKRVPVRGSVDATCGRYYIPHRPLTILITLSSHISGMLKSYVLAAWANERRQSSSAQRSHI